MRVLIAGCGYVGTELALRLLRRNGLELYGLKRDPSGLPEGVHPVAADLLDPDLHRAIPVVDTVVYAVSADSSSEIHYRQAYVEGLRNVLEVVHSWPVPPSRLIFTSSTAVYADTDGDWVDEDTPPDPSSYRGKILLEAEGLISGTDIDAVCLRLGGIYGPGRTRLVERVRSGEAKCPGGRALWTNRIHRNDAARATAHLLGIRDPAPVYIGVDDQPSPICEVYRYVADLLGAPEPVIAPEDSGLRSGKRCSNQRLRDSGFRFEFPSFIEGYRELVEAG